MTTKTQDNHQHLYNEFGDFGLDVYAGQDALIEVNEHPGVDGLECEFKADRKRLEDLKAGVEWALERMGGE